MGKSFGNPYFEAAGCVVAVPAAIALSGVAVALLTLYAKGIWTVVQWTWGLW